MKLNDRYREKFVYVLFIYFCLVYLLLVILYFKCFDAVGWVVESASDL